MIDDGDWGLMMVGGGGGSDDDDDDDNDNNAVATAVVFSKCWTTSVEARGQLCRIYLLLRWILGI